MAKKITTPAPALNFETALAELEGLVQRMERGELALEDSLKEFERGVQLTRICQDMLKTAEQRVRVFSADGTETDFPQLDESVE